MATTSPDNLKTPDAGDQYALVQDLGALADTTQAALVKRANSYVGTSAQRTAFTTAPEGTSWQDTNGNRNVYVRQSGDWRMPSFSGRVGPFPLVAGGGNASMTVSIAAAGFAADPIVVQSLAVGTSRNLDLRLSSVSPTSLTFRIGNFSAADLPAGQYVHFIASAAS